MPLTRIAENLAAETDRLQFQAPVSHVYNPLVYAWAPHRLYLERFAKGKKRAVLVGMNPGPFGMAQTGVPFGDVEMVREWMGIEAPVSKPAQEHPKRPVQGFDCPRREVSGSRLWGWARDRFGSPAAFFSTFFVHNYCPLCFMAETGRNITPDKLPAAEQDRLFACCDAALAGIIDALEPEWVIGIGKFAERRVRHTLNGCDVRIAGMPHPSPASPAANRGWASLAEGALLDAGVPLE